MMKFRKTIPEELIKLGTYLKNLRKELGLSIHQAAQKTKLTASYISKIENCQTFKSVTAQTLINFSKAYNVPIQLILEKAGFLEKQDDLPGLGTYLRLKYNASLAAAKDMEIAWEIIENKYK